MHFYIKVIINEGNILLKKENRFHIRVVLSWDEVSSTFVHHQWQPRQSQLRQYQELTDVVIFVVKQQHFPRRQIVPAKKQNF